MIVRWQTPVTRAKLRILDPDLWLWNLDPGADPKQNRDSRPKAPNPKPCALNRARPWSLKAKHQMPRTDMGLFMPDSTHQNQKLHLHVDLTCKPNTQSHNLRGARTQTHNWMHFDSEAQALDTGCRSITRTLWPEFGVGARHWSPAARGHRQKLNRMLPL